MLQYEKYPLSRLISIQEIVSADYLLGVHPAVSRHAHQDAWELCCCMKGQVTVLKDTLSVPLAEGEITLIQPGTQHNILVEDKTAQTFVISFTCVSKHLRTLQNTVISADEDLLSLFRKMHHELKRSFRQKDTELHLMHFTPSENSPIGAEQMISCYLEQAVILMLRSVTMRSGNIVRTRHFQEALQDYLAEQVHAYISEHITEPLRVETLASHFHYSRGRFSAMIKDATGFSPSELITFRRIRRAKELLAEGEKTVSQIAEELCFASPQYFSYKFTKEVGCPPSHYAQQAAKEAEE